MLEKDSVKKCRIIIDIKPLSTTHSICSVQTQNGRQYSCVWANEYNEDGNLESPTIEQVRAAWKTDKKNFEPYSVFRGY